MILIMVLAIALAALICYSSCYVAARADKWEESYWQKELLEDDYEPKHAKH